MGGLQHEKYFDVLEEGGIGDVSMGGPTPVRAT